MPESNIREEIIVMGIGQALRGDDALGLEVVRHWQSKYPDSAALVRVVISNQPCMDLINILDTTKSLILVDAVKSSEPAGTILRIDPHNLYHYSHSNQSSHGCGAVETLKLWEILYPSRNPRKIILIGIVAIKFSFGTPICDSGLTAIAPAADQLEKEVSLLLHSTQVS